jgi:pimeloyl-ACP methyl ester carboxylesterase
VTSFEVASGTARLICDVDGAGDTVVLVHAGIADARMWDPLVDRLAPGWRVVRYDLRGYGRSALPPGPFSHVDDLAAVLDATATGPVHLVGASLGGRVALDLALDRPGVVRSLVLLDAVVSGFEPDTPAPPLWDAVAAAGRADDLDALADAEARMWLADPDGDRLPAGVLDLVRTMDRIALGNERSGVAEERPAEPAVDRLGGLDRPVLVVDGALDLDDIRLAAELLAARLPRAERVRLPGVAHLPALERPDDVARLLRHFLARAG